MTDYIFSWTDPLIRVVSAVNFIKGGIYSITSLGTTNFTTIGAVSYIAGSFVIGNSYIITSLGTTNFTTIGASSNTVGLIFTALGVGTGTGTALLTKFTSTAPGIGTGTATWSAFIVNANLINNTATSLSLNGKGSLNWGEILQQSMLNMLEHFASPYPPSNPTVGEFWYNDTTSTISLYTAQGWNQLTTVQAIQGENFSLDTGIVNAYVTSLTPTITSYSSNFGGKFKASNTNTGPSTLNAGGGALPLLNDIGNPVTSGDIQTGSIISYYFVYSENRFYITSYTFSLTDPRYLSILGTTNSLLVGSPTVSGDAINLGYANSNFANINGNSLNNFLVSSSPTSYNDATSLGYVQSYVNTIAATLAIILQNIPFASTISWNISLGEAAKVILSGNANIAAPTNLKVDGLVLILIQDSVGSRTVTWDPVFKWPSGIVPVLSTTPYANDVCSFFSDGIYLYGSYLRGVS